MQSVNQPDIPHDVISAGVDWITATAQRGDNRWNMEYFTRLEFERAQDSGVEVKPAFRLGYQGHSMPGYFHGNRQGSSIILASGRTAASIYRSVAEISDHVARLDVQVTIFTPIERPHLGIQAYEALSAHPPASIPVRNVALITAHPEGETCNVGKRKSDQSGRIYDKATEAHLGQSRSVWRYEIEGKRSIAASWLSHLISSSDTSSAARSLVHRWFSERGLRPCFKPAASSCTQELAIAEKRRDTLAWLRDTISVSVARMVKRHGMRAVDAALGLSMLHQLNCERRTDYAAVCRCVVQDECDVPTVRPELR